MNVFKECILHIGTEKTGTKTLQGFLNKNRHSLANESIFFPKTFGELSHKKLAAYACMDDKIDDIRQKLGLINPELIKNFREKIFVSFQNEIKNQNSKKLLISDEHLQSRLTRIEEIQFLKKFLDNFTNNYKIVVYLRSQLEMAVSYYSTFCKAGGTRESVLPEVTEDEIYFNHEKLLERWSNVFGSENITPKIYSRKEFPDGDIKRDFIDLLNLNWNNFEDTKNHNESLNIEAQKFLLEINKFLPNFIGNRPNKDRGDIVKFVSQNREGDGLLPTRKQAENFIKIFDVSNERLRRKWFPERKKLFNIDLSSYPETPNLDTDHTFAFKIFAEIWSKKHAQVLSLIEENEAIKNQFLDMNKK